MDGFPIGLTDLELDALTELVNLGVSNSALSLRELVREEVMLSVPNVAMVTRDQAIANLSGRNTKRLVAVQQDFSGEINGRALLIFPEVKSMELVRAVVGGHLSLEDIADLEHEALAETGNILLNGCLGTIANSFQRSLQISLPEVLYGEGSEFFSLRPGSSNEDSILFIHITFAVRLRDIEGYIAMLLDIQSVRNLKGLLGAFIERSANYTQK